jgi:hypothetical protein
MADNTRKIAEFWQVFLDHEGDLAKASSADEPVYDLILHQLQNIDQGLFFEFSTNLETYEFIITAEGKVSLFPLVEYIVDNAPDTGRWLLKALKPKLGFPITTRWEGYTVSICDVVFEPLERKGSRDLGIRLYVPNLSSSRVNDAHNALLRAIDHGLGERKFAESVQFTEVHLLPEGAKIDDYIPRAELEKYIDWWNRQ